MEWLVASLVFSVLTLAYTVYVHNILEQVRNSLEVFEFNTDSKLKWLTETMLTIEIKQAKPVSTKAGAINSLKKVSKTINKKAKQ